MIYAIAGALVIGIALGLFGSGGSILTVPLLVYVLDHEPKTAIVESLAIVGGIALLGAWSGFRAGLVDGRSIAVFGLPGIVGTYMGAWLGGSVVAVAQLLVFAGVLLLSSVMMWRQQTDPRSAPRDSVAAQRALGPLALGGLAAGILTGFVGVGGGFLIVPALILLARLDMNRAVASSLVIIALNCAAGLVKYLANHVDSTPVGGAGLSVVTVVTFIAIGTVGSIVGRHVGGRLEARRLRRIFAAVTFVMGMLILAREVRPLHLVSCLGTVIIRCLDRE